MLRCFLALSLVFAASFTFAGGGGHEYQSAITYKGKIENVTTAKATVNGKEVGINVVNGFVPDEVMEVVEKEQGIGRFNITFNVTFRNFIFRYNPTKYEKGRKYEYIDKRGPTIMHGSYCYIYKLKK